MLDFLHIENVAVIKKLEINFGKGFNVLTGETGAGKSIIIDSINMLLGSKVTKEIIRYGEECASVTAYFSDLNDEVYKLCDELDIQYDRDDVFSISRTFSLEGKNTVKINSRPATLTQLKAIGVKLINIHGQNENHSFMNKSNHILMLDEYIDIQKELEEYGTLYQKLTSYKSQIASLIEESKQKTTMVDILKYQIKEISSAKLKDENEEEKLIELKNKLKGAEKIIKSSNTVYRALLKNESGISVVVLIDKAIDALSRLEDFDSSVKNMIEVLESYKYEIEDIAERAKDIGNIEGIDEPEKQLMVIEDRLALIQMLEKKYAPTIPLLIEFKEKCEEKLKSLEESEATLEDLKQEYKKTYSQACEIAEILHEKRILGAKKLSALIQETLSYLDMPKVRFEISVQSIKKDSGLVLSLRGSDDVEFLIATNVGEELASMNKIASGGELSRIMLALKSAVSDKNGAQAIVFDEIDTGVSGSTSQRIGIKLAGISKRTQTFCVTHSAQIAALADNHYFIKKDEIDGRAETKILLLVEQERISEIARIIGGINITEKQIAAAKDLLSQSRNLLD